MNPERLRRDGEEGRLPLSVVVIAENEEERIGACIESIMAACRRAVPAFEIVVVDSASADRTVARASEYPATVLRIPAAHTVSCGAGRYVGDQVATGERVLHVDGDMRLTEAWLPRAVEYLDAHEDVAAVEGCLNRSNQDGVVEVDKVGGVMLYDADALAAVGGFDPHLEGYEDVDAGFRLSTAGHRLVRLPEVSAEHPESEGALWEPIRRWRHGYFFAPGQAIRKSLGSPRILRLLLARQRFEAAVLAWLCVGAVSLVSAAAAVAWVAASLLGFGWLAARRGPAEATQLGISKLLGLVGLAYGLGYRPRPAAAFPLDEVEVLQRGEVLRGAAQVDRRRSG